MLGWPFQLSPRKEDRKDLFWLRPQILARVKDAKAHSNLFRFLQEAGKHFLSSLQLLLERLYPHAPQKRLAIALSAQQLALDKPASPSSLGIHVTALPRSCLCFCLVGSNPQMVLSFLFFTKLSIICVCFISVCVCVWGGPVHCEYN